MYGFSYNGRHSSEFGIIMRSKNRQVLPISNDNYIQIPGRHGSYLFPGGMADRIIEIDCAITSESLENMRAKIRDIAAWLYATERQALSFDDEPDKCYYGKLDDAINLEQSYRTGKFVLRFRCEPFAYGPEKAKIISAQPMSFSRASVAHMFDGTQVAQGVPRWQSPGKGGAPSALLVEGKANNYALNPSFEDGTGPLADHWFAVTTGSPTVTWSIDDVNKRPSGSRAQKAVITAGASQATVELYQDTLCLTTPLKGWCNSIYYKILANTGTITVEAKLSFLDELGSELATTKSASILETDVNGWKRVAVSRTAPSNDFIEVEGRFLITIPANGSVTIVFDDAQLDDNYYKSTFVNGATREADIVSLNCKGLINQTNEGEIDIFFYNNWQIQSIPIFIKITNDLIYNGKPINSFELRKSTSNIGQWRFTIYDKNGNPFEVQGEKEISTNQWHHIAAKWSKDEIALFIDGIKIGSEVPTNLDLIDEYKPATKCYLGTGNEYYNADCLLTQLHISPRALSDQEISDIYNAGTADVSITGGAKWPLEGDFSVVTDGTVINEGNVATYPLFTASFSQDSTFLNITKQSKDKEYILIGQPQKAEDLTIQKYQKILVDYCSNLTGWVSGTAVDGGAIAGALITDGVRFNCSNYGAGAGWHGPAMKKSLSEPLTDFVVEAKIKQANTVAGIGRAEIYLLDANGVIFGRMGMSDPYSNKQLNIGYIRAGAESGGRYLLSNCYGSYKGQYNNFLGMLKVWRIGNRWFAYIAQIDPKGRHFAIQQATFYDVNPSFGAQLAQIQVHLGQYGTVAATNQAIEEITVYKYNDPIAAAKVPYIGLADESLEIDCYTAAIRKKGLPMMEDLDIGSTFFALDPGSNTLVVDPEGVNVMVTQRSRWL